jgi:hypothetical protein
MKRIGVAEFSSNEMGWNMGAWHIIRLKPHLYVSGKPFGLHMTLHLVRDLLVEGANGIDVMRSANWWLIRSGMDWLCDQSGEVTLEPFSMIIPFPKAGIEGMRSEVVIASLSEAVVTCGRDGVNWIKGSRSEWAMPPDIVGKLVPSSNGRTLASLLNEGSEGALWQSAFG